MAGLGLAGRVGVVAPVRAWLMEKVAPHEGALTEICPPGPGTRDQALALPLSMA